MIRRRVPVRAGFFYVYTACTLGANAVILIPFDPSGTIGDNRIFSASWVLLHIVSLLVLLTSKKVRAVPLIIALGIGGFLVLSAAWSVSWVDSLVYGSMAAGNIVMACVLAAEFTLRQIAQMLLRVITVMVVAGMLASFLGYDQVRDFDPHARPNFLGGQPIRGFFQHNIMAGFFAASGAALALSMLRGARRIAVLATLVAFVLLTGSATGFLLMAAAAIVVPVAKRVVPKVRAAILFAVGLPAAAVVGAVAWQVWVPLLEALGRDPTLTGRTILWDWGHQAVAERPVLGWGFGAYFRSPYGELPSLYVPQFFQYEIAHYHNSYIQTAVDLGIIGLLILVLVLLYTFGKAYAHASTGDADTGVGLLMMLLIFLIASPTEFLFLNHNHFGTFALFSIFFSLAALNRTPRHTGAT